MSVAAFVGHVRIAMRGLRRTPAFAAGSIATVALTVGATTSIFSLVYGVLLRELPYRNAAQIFWIWSDQPGRDRTPFNVPDFVDYRDSNRTLAGLAGFFGESANLSDEAAGERLQGIRATGNMFDVLGASPRLGRLLTALDEAAAADHVVVLSEGVWTRRFGADPGVIGRSIRLNGEQYTVVGVVGSSFAMPIRDVDFVLPFAPDRDPRRAARNSVSFIVGAGRLTEGTSPQQAATDLTAIARRLQQQYPVENARKRAVRLVPLVDGIVGSFRTALLTLFAAVGAVLVIACANLANLMLTRATARRKEVALRLALGSSRTNVIAQVMVEATLVGLAGGALGAMAVPWAVVALAALAPAALPRASAIGADRHVLLFSLVLSLATAVLFGVVPAIASAGVDVRDALQGTSRGTTSRRGARGLLVSCEVALAVALVIVMAMLAKSFSRVQAVAPGFEPAHVLTARLTLPARRFATREAVVTFQRALGERLAEIPTVTHAGAVSLLPLSGLLARIPFTVEGRPIERARIPSAQYRVVSPGYFEAACIPVTHGRAFSELDTDRTRPVAIVNEALARQWLAGGDAVGARLLIDDNDGPPRPVEIAGVVGNVQQIALDGEPTWDIYLPYAQVHPDNVGAAAANMFWLVRTTGDSATLASPVAAAVHRIDPDVVAAQIRPMEAYLADSIAPRRFSLSLMTVFGIAALALAGTGIYAVTTYSVQQRRREINIRVALGARRSNIARLIVGQYSGPIGAGVAVGIGLAAATARLASTMLFGVRGVDAAIAGVVAAIVAAISLAACAVPTLRAGRARPLDLNVE